MSTPTSQLRPLSPAFHRALQVRICLIAKLIRRTRPVEVSSVMPRRNLEKRLGMHFMNRSVRPCPRKYLYLLID